MKIFEYMEKYDYEQLVFCHDEASGLKAIIAIHDTTLGPALGGTRMWVYETEEAAIEDVGFCEMTVEGPDRIAMFRADRSPEKRPGKCSSRCASFFGATVQRKKGPG